MLVGSPLRFTTKQTGPREISSQFKGRFSGLLLWARKLAIAWEYHKILDKVRYSSAPVYDKADPEAVDLVCLVSGGTTSGSICFDPARRSTIFRGRHGNLDVSSSLLLSQYSVFLEYTANVGGTDRFREIVFNT